jgi:type I restriction enzyme R subunit
MAHGFKESDFQNGVFIPYLTAPQPDGLDWIFGKPADIDAMRWIVPGDLLHFLRDGCPLNAAAYARAMKGYDSDAAFLQAFLTETLLPKVAAKANAAFVLRESLSVLPASRSCCGTKRRAPGRMPGRRICSERTSCA